MLLPGLELVLTEPLICDPGLLVFFITSVGSAPPTFGAPLYFNSRKYETKTITKYTCKHISQGFYTAIK